MTRKQEQRIAKFREVTRRVTWQTTALLWIFSLSAVGLFVASFCVPPTGVIDGSVLKAVALLFAFGALAEAREAIREGLGVKLTHGSTTIEVHDLDGPGAPHHGGHPQQHNDDDYGDEDNG
jgi:hypothetical protein